MDDLIKTLRSIQVDEDSEMSEQVIVCSQGKRYFIFHTCTIDTGLFILYHAYKVHSDEFRALFTSDALNIYKIIRRTFQLVETEG